MGIFKSKSRSNRPEGGKTIIAEGCSISGEMTDLQGPLHIDGRVDGVIDSEFGVSIGINGHVTGLVKAKSIVLSGVLDGKIACDKIDILGSGKLIGELICGEVTIETGGKFIGQSHEMTEGGMVVSLPETFAQLEATSVKKTTPKSIGHAAQKMSDSEFVDVNSEESKETADSKEK